MTKLDLEKIERKKTERKELLQSSLERLLPQLESMGAVKVVVFGSLADGTIHSRSDLDILVIMPQERSGREWSHLIYSKIDRAIASDILVFNTVELAEEVKANVFLQHVLEGGRSVFEKDS
ncbi:MAG: nucleotidyltransferase domain-containing protein [Actinobacteria bacterium]|jgi:predicted nucleotidyltransferase|nr:MAG: nucleotidyltransferase domain-containing protein [Actinomycetota bacterium]